MSVTLEDVAKKAGVSTKTVSRAVNGEKGISEEKREEILRIVDEMNYVPHAQAQNLASGKTHSIALHYPMSNPKLVSERLEMNFVAGIAGEAAQAGYYFSLFTGELNESELKRICRASIADGLILMQVSMDDWRVELLRKLNFPFVMIGRCQNNDGLDFVDFDFQNAVLESYSHLVKLGHRKIGFFSYPDSWQKEKLGPAIRSRQGFEAAVERLGLEPIFYEAGLSVETCQADVEGALREHPDMTACVVVRNAVAVGAINAVQGLGKRIPEDFSITGISMGRESDFIIPALTAIHWEGDEIGAKATKILLAKLTEKHHVHEQHLFLPNMEVRKSTGPGKINPKIFSPLPQDVQS
jgi:DNA-binding LacI/PurR family transcriptional regulator